MTENLVKSINWVSTTGNRAILMMVVEWLLSPEYWEQIGPKIVKALERNCALTSSYTLSRCRVEDVSSAKRGYHPDECGFYVTFIGTKCKVSFFVNNEGEIVRKPRNTVVKYTYDYHLDEGF